MKKIDIKKMTAMAAALVMCISMSACGQTEESAATNGDTAKGTAVKKEMREKAPDAVETADDYDAETTRADDRKSAMAAEEATEAAADTDAALEFSEKSDGAALADIAGIESFDAATAADGGEEMKDAGEVDIDDSKTFVLTAGEWNDNDNWGFFTNLVKNGTINFPVFGIDPTHRIAVTLTKDGEPARDQPVELLDSEGNVIWTARSNKNGVAYVFYKADQQPAQVRSGDATAEVTGDSADEQGKAGTSEAALEVKDSKVCEETQVMFILDTTGSMYDEIAYLQMDFSSIAKEVDDGHTTFSANFYRDEGDEYVTKCNPFSNDVKAVQSAINRESADGGGDFPEAIAEVLEETITNNDEWSESANKIAFLIFDAPPHDNKAEKLEAAIKTASAKGIHLVPVVSSGADRQTELFGRAMAAQTGSSYVFLTDDSGVGGSHIEPIIGDYDVELLHDVIVRNITELRS